MISPRILWPILLGLPLLSCGQSGDSSGGTTVAIYDNSFNPTVIRIPVGTRLSWVNTGRVTHTAIALDSSWAATVGKSTISMNHDDIAEYRFDKPGIYRYYCHLHGTKDGKGMAGVVVVGDVPYQPEGSKGALKVVAVPSGTTRHVPKDYPTIQAAVDAADPGDLVLVEKGVYKEEVKVTTPSLVIRGVDRNETIIDGEFVRGNGIMVLADAVAVENMTARNSLLNGFFWTGVTGFRASFLTAYNNGDYGIYAFGATDGIFENSYASGSPDSGFYVGQCYPCNAVIRNVIAENNGLGFSGTNAGGNFYVVSSIWRNNRAGIVPSSLDIELDPPQHDAVFAANLVMNNNNRKAPSITIAAPAYGNGILNGGGVGDTFERNVVINHPAFGIMMSSIVDKHYYAAKNNIVRNNQVYGSGVADLGVGGPGSSGNVFTDNSYTTAAPAGVTIFNGPGGLRLPLGLNPLPYVKFILDALASAGATYPDFRKQPAPPSQTSMPEALTAPVRPAFKVFENLHFDLAKADLPPGAAAEIERAKSGGAQGSDVEVSGLSRLANRWGLYVLFLCGVLWIVLALRDLIRRSDMGMGGKVVWGAAVLAVPYLGATAYHVASRPALSRSFRMVVILGGFLVCLATVWFGTH